MSMEDNPEYIVQESYRFGKRLSGTETQSEYEDSFQYQSKVLPMLREMVGYEHTRISPASVMDSYHCDSFSRAVGNSEHRLETFAIPAFFAGFNQEIEPTVEELK